MSDTSRLTDRQRYWLEHINACRDSNQSLKAYAVQHGLKVSSLYGAKKRLKRQGVLEVAPGGHRFVRVHSPAPLRTSVPCRVLLVNGTVVELGCRPEDFAAVFQAVSRLP